MEKNAGESRSLVSYLHAKAEDDKAALARQLHDQVGGLLVGAMMDATWAERHLPPSARESQEKLQRIRQSLGSVIDLKRKMVEELRPTLLDNVGLFAALRWLLKNICEETDVSCTGEFLEIEPDLEPRDRIAIFRFVQEALRLVLRRKSPSAIVIAGVATEASVTVQLTYRGQLITEFDEREPEFASMKHRIQNIDGEFEVFAKPESGATFSACIVLRPASNA